MRGEQLHFSFNEGRDTKKESGPEKSEFTEEELAEINVNAERLFNKKHLGHTRKTALDVARISMRGRKLAERNLDGSRRTEILGEQNPELN